MKQSRKRQLDALEKILAHKFSDRELLNTALTHPSYANEQKQQTPDYERLEFLGGSVLGLIISEHLWKILKYDEGTLTRVKSYLVQSETLNSAARRISLGSYILLGQGEDSSGGRERVSTLENVFEAIIGALYLDGGFEAAKNFVLEALSEELQDVDETEIKKRDYKSYLQEVLQARSLPAPTYKTLEQSGPIHKPEFRVGLFVNNLELEQGVGKTKKTAEQNAAELFLSALDRNEVNLDELSKPEK